MAVELGLGVPGGIDYRVHCVQLATAVEALLEEAPAGTETNKLARLMLAEYRRAVASLNAQPRPDNVVELRPFSLAHVIDDVRRNHDH